MDGEGNWETIAPPEPDGRGVLEHWLERIAVGQRLQPPTIVVRRSVYERIGGFDSRAGLMGEDWEMWVRIAAHFPVWYEPEPLALYRIHDSSITARPVQGRPLRPRGQSRDRAEPHGHSRRSGRMRSAGRLGRLPPSEPSGEPKGCFTQATRPQRGARS